MIQSFKTKSGIFTLGIRLAKFSIIIDKQYFKKLNILTYLFQLIFMQIHVHTGTCFKKNKRGDKTWRFGYPREYFSNDTDESIEETGRALYAWIPTRYAPSFATITAPATPFLEEKLTPRKRLLQLLSNDYSSGSTKLPKFNDNSSSSSSARNKK